MQRIHSRGGLPAEEIKRRIKSSLKELDAALTENYYSFVINMEIEATIIEVDAIAKSSETNPKYQQLGRQLAKKLFQAAENYLQTAKA
jgi:guanylate kinase